MIKIGLIGKGYYGSFIHKKLTSEPISNICKVSWVANSKKDYKSLVIKNKVDWVDLSIRREQTEVGITKNYSFNNLKGWTFNINPWYEDREVIDVITTMNVKRL